MRLLRCCIRAAFTLAIASAPCPASDLRFERIGPLNPTFGPDPYDGTLIRPFSNLFAPIGTIQDGPHDATLGDIAIYVTERFYNGSGNLGMEYTYAATNGRDIWNLNSPNGELIGSTYVPIEFRGSLYFSPFYNGPYVSDGLSANPLPGFSQQNEHWGYGPFGQLDNHVVFLGEDYDPISTISRLGFFYTTGATTDFIDRTLPENEPLRCECSAVAGPAATK